MLGTDRKLVKDFSCSSLFTYGLLLRQITRGTQNNDDGVVLELHVPKMTLALVIGSQSFELLTGYCAAQRAALYPSTANYELVGRGTWNKGIDAIPKCFVQSAQTHWGAMEITYPALTSSCWGWITVSAIVADVGAGGRNVKAQLGVVRSSGDKVTQKHSR